MFVRGDKEDVLGIGDRDGVRDGVDEEVEEK